ncbi:MFS transporter [Actinoallomurus bryophytorum]|nr:MFS transporter [Actinoallomurus bryophytorum]
MADGSSGDNGGLLRQRDFRHLWAADLISQLGTRVSYLAVPLLAVSTLNASAFEVSLLRAFQTVAYLLIGLQVGAWCDRIRCRPVLVVADLGRAVALGSVPLAAALGVLGIGQLYVVVFVVGVLTVFFDVAHQTYLPRLVERARLIEGNARLQGNASVAAVAAPTLAGYLVQWFTGAGGVLADAASYLWSALWLRSIHRPEQAPPREGSTRMREEIRAGLRLVSGDPILRAIAGSTATFCLAQAIYTAIIVVFLVRVVHLSPAAIGLLNTVGLTGALVAAFATRPLAALLGQARLLWLTVLVAAAGFVLVPLTGPGARLAFFAVGGFVTSFGIIACNIVEVSFQQARCPAHLLGRLNATVKFLMWGTISLGSVLGGVLAGLVGLRSTLWIAAMIVGLSTLWLVLSPLRRMRDLPTATPTPHADQAPAT